ncbi:MAG TPA: GFA family protein [Rhizomicrobium sp.]|nr:GFA family protein [Rhizomicrobium sp.]
MSTIHSGSCFCGFVRYRLTSAPMFIHCCHCRDCQKQSGGAFAINALIEADRMEVSQGDTVPVSMHTDSGRPHIIHRCPKCQTALWSNYGGRNETRFVRVSTLDDAARFAPDVHIFTRSKLPWVRLPEGARVFEVYYDTKTEWPAESLARRKANAEKAAK